jgi:hypothetical protein
MKEEVRRDCRKPHELNPYSANVREYGELIMPANARWD